LQKIIDCENINNYQSSGGSLADDVDVSVDYGMDLLDGEVPVDNEEFDVTEITVSKVTLQALFVVALDDPKK
ncbi:14817_t:CDS:2, partial [Racocetra fulgida]